MAKRIGGPANLDLKGKLLHHPVMPNGILIQYIIIVADSFIIFHPASIPNLDLSVMEKISNLLLLGGFEVVVPIFEEDNFCDEISAGAVLS